MDRIPKIELLQPQRDAVTMSNQLLPYMDRIPKIELLQPQRDAVTMSKALELFLEQESSWGREEAAPDAFLFYVIHTSSARKCGKSGPLTV